MISRGKLRAEHYSMLGKTGRSYSNRLSLPIFCATLIPRLVANRPSLQISRWIVTVQSLESDGGGITR